jgi:UDP-N-acetylmuramyl pentapeptide phosphotransferase/UDP-N-acetylglucosamine-1-phosphate transferase
MPPYAPILTILFCLILTLGFAIWIRKRLLAHNLLDHPNARSSHTQSVPRGGGWAFLIVLMPGMILTGFFQHGLTDHVGIIAGTLLLALISWHDDKKGVSPLPRLSIHILAACLGSLAFDTHQTLFAGALPFWLDRTLMIVGWAWFMNLYNFMDGIDGITCTETIAIATGVCLLMTAANINDPFVEVLTLMLTGACLGFLALNWHPAKIFMGDIGSIPLGYLAGYVLLSVAVHGYLVPALILPLYYLADSGITITKRALRGEKIWQPHRQHFYQRAAHGLGRHDKVVLLIALADIALIAAAILAISVPIAGIACAALIVAILLLKMHKSAQ